MSMRALSRWHASGLHLLISAAIAAVVVTLMLAAWYPRPLFEAAGGNNLMVILVSVDIVIGPLCTLVIFKAGKRGLKFDLTAIALLQVAALAYGVYVVSLARPAFIVFVKDRFELAITAELDRGELAKAKFQQFSHPPLGGPILAAADLPDDPAERKKLIDMAQAGIDLHHFPRYWVPYEERRAQVLEKAATAAQFRKAEPAMSKIVDAHLAESATAEDAVRILLLKTRFAWLAVLIDPKTAEPLKMLLVEKLG